MFSNLRDRFSSLLSSEYLTKKNVALALVFGIVVLSIPVGVDLVQNQQVLKSRADTTAENGVYRVRDGEKYLSFKTVAQMRNELSAAGWPAVDTQKSPKDVFYLFERTGPAGRLMNCVVNKGDLSNMLPQVQIINPGDRVNITVVQKWEDEPSRQVTDMNNHPYTEHRQWKCNEWWPNVKFTNKTTGHVFDHVCSNPKVGGIPDSRGVSLGDANGYNNISWEGNFNQERPNEANPGLYDTFAPLEQVKSCTAVVPEAGEYQVEIFYADRKDPVATRPNGTTDDFQCDTGGPVRSFCGFATGASGAAGYSGGSTNSGGTTGTGSNPSSGGVISGGGTTPLTSLPQSAQPTTLSAPSTPQVSCLNDTTAHITWSGGDGVKGYRIRLDKNPGASAFSTSDGDIINDAYYASGGDFSVTPSTTYKFWVNSFNDNVANSPTSTNVLFSCPNGALPASVSPGGATSGGTGSGISPTSVLSPTPAVLGAPSSLRSYCISSTQARFRWKRDELASKYLLTINGQTFEVVNPTDPNLRPFYDTVIRTDQNTWSVVAVGADGKETTSTKGDNFVCNL